MTIFEIIIFTLVLVLFVSFVVEFYNIVFKGFAPFIPSRPKVINKIVEEMEIAEDAKIIELGCGNAGFLRKVRKKYPKASLRGVEYSFFPFFIAGIQNMLGGTNIKLVREDFYKTKVSDADFIYCYLNVNTMKKLEEKFKKECKAGAQVISFTFPMKNTVPVKKYPVGSVGEKIFFYKM